MGYTSDTERRKMQIKEMQIKAAIKHHYLTGHTIKLTVILSDSNDAERVDQCDPDDRNVKCCIYLGQHR